MSAGRLEALGLALARGGEADDVLRSFVRILVDDPAIAWAAIAFLENGQLVVGPEAGSRGDARRIRTEVVFQGSKVGELWVDGVVDAALLEHVAHLVAPYVLIGWDTGGVTWDP